MYKKHFNSFSGKISPDRKNFNTSYPTSICSGNYYTGGGISTTKRVVESLQAPRHAELVSASPDLTRRFRNKFGMTTEQPPRLLKQAPLQRRGTVPLPWRGDICESKCRGGKLTRGLAPVIIAIVLAISMSANLMAQTTKIVTFTAASPPILTGTDITDALEIAFPDFASFEEFIAVIHPDVTTIGGTGNNFTGTYTLSAGSFNVNEYLIAIEGENVTTINDYCFGSADSLSACYNLASADFPLLETIGEGAFRNCGSLESADFPEALSIGNSAFQNCVSLESADFPEALSIGNSAFNYCFNLVSVNFPLALSIGNSAFGGCGLVSVDFPLAESIGDAAFGSCISLESVEFPKAESIGEGAFTSCISLESVEFPKAESIGFYAFTSCISLESVEFPKAESIGFYAFNNCTSLEDLTLGAVPPTLGSSVFYGVPLSNVTLHIPEGTLCDYRDDSYWASYFSPTLRFDAVEEYSVSTPVTYYTLEVDVDGNGSATSGATGITCGNTKTLRATPDACHQFVNWTSDNGFTSTANPINIVVKNDTSIVAHFIPIFPVPEHTLSLLNDGNGSASVSGGPATGITCNDSRTITATPNDCYEFDKWTNADNTELSTNATEYITVIKDSTIKANFKLISPAPTYTLTLEDDGNGTAAGSGGSLTAIDCGDSRTITATPDPCYEFDKWTNADNTELSTNATEPITFFKDSTIKANFKLISPAPTYTLTLADDGNGSASATGSVTGITCGDSRTITATPNACYVFAKWTNSGGDSISNVNPLDVDVISDTTLTANFTTTTATYTLTLLNDGNGTAAGSGGSLTGITCGDSRIITATPNDCYEFVNWTNANNTELSTNATETITFFKDSTIKANFKLIFPVPTYTLSVGVNYSAMGTASSSVSSATCGSSVSVDATPNGGYKFVGWDDGGGLVSTDNPHTFNIGDNTSLTAIFDLGNKKQRIKKINVKKGRLIITPQP